MIHSPSAASQAHRLRSRLTALCLMLILAAASLATAAGLRPNQRPATAAQADVPLAPEVLSWRQRTAEEWASADFRQTTYATGEGVVLAEAAFVRSDAGDFDDFHHAARAFAPFDADGDGDLDLALANTWGVELLLNDGTGVFSMADAGALNDRITWDLTTIAPFDADGDGDVDLAVGSEGGGSALFLNHGDACFSASSDIDLRLSIYALLSFDADGDGDIDLAVGAYGSSALYRNDGAGRFAPVRLGDFYNTTQPVLAALDADGDGDVDLAAPGSSYPTGPGRLYLNSGDGVFALSPAGDLANASGPVLVALDADGDGHTDLATPGQLFRNDGTGSFSLVDAGDFTASAGSGRHLTALDADGDGDTDLVVGNWGTANSLYRNDGLGNFTQVDAGEFDDNTGYTEALGALDADGDGAPDLVAQVGARSMLYHNQGGGSFGLSDAGDLSNEARNTRAMAAFDANGDGAPDLAIAGTPNALFLNDGSGRFARLADGDYAGAGQVAALAHFDADGDGDLDLATANSVEYTGQTNRLFRNDGSGWLTLMDAGAFDDPVSDTRGVMAFDADGDTDVDLAVANWNAANALYLNDGQRSFFQADAGDFDDPARNTTRLLAFDADGDGDFDLCAINYSYSAPNEFYRNDGAGVFSLVEAGDLAGAGDDVQISFDADGDGDEDLLALGYTLRLLQNNGQGWFTAHTASSQINIGGNEAAALDYDHDGDADLAISRLWGPPSVLLANDGAGYFSQVYGGDLAMPITGGQGLVVLDVDQDGDLDVARPGQMLTYENLFDIGSVTSPVVNPAFIYPASGHLLAWQRLTVQEVLPPDADVRYDVLDAGSGAVIPGFANLRPGAAGQIDLAGISAAAYPAIRLRATLLDLHGGSDYLDRSPRLYEWAVDFAMTSEETRRTVDAYRVATPPVVDGDLGDWPARPAAIELTLHSADTVRTQPPGSPPPQPADSSALLWAAWTGDALYLAVHVRDDVIVNDSPDVWRDDEIELAFDGLRDLQSSNRDDHQYTINPDGRLTDFGDPSSHPSIQIGVRPVAGGWDVEARIPAARLHAGALHLSQEIGFSLGLHDDDDGGNWDSFLIWEGANTWSGASGFGVLRLVTPDGATVWQQRSFGDWRASQFTQTVIDRPVVQPVDAGSFPATAILAFDADGDDDLDLAASDGLYQNDGAGRFTHVAAGDFEGGMRLVAFDADGDDDLDLATPGRIYRNNGAGSFSLADAGQFSQDTGGSALLAFDADGDGDLDLALPGRVYLNDGWGVFTRTDAGEFAGTPWSRALAALDVDEDGDLDLVVGNSGDYDDPCYYQEPGHIWTCNNAANELFLNDGAAVFSRAQVELFQTEGADADYTEFLAVFDADGDGDTDLMSGNFGYCQYYVSTPSYGCRGTGSVLYINDSDRYFSSAWAVGQGWTTGLATLDLDGNRVTDVAMARTGDDPWDWVLRPANSIHRNNGSANFSSLDAGSFARAGSGPLVGIDADGDALDDLALAGALYLNRWHDDACIGLGSAGFVRQLGTDHVQPQTPAAPEQNITIPIDFDNDGDDDRVTGYVGGLER